MNSLSTCSVCLKLSTKGSGPIKLWNLNIWKKKTTLEYNTQKRMLKNISTTHTEQSIACLFYFNCPSRTTTVSHRVTHCNINLSEYQGLWNHIQFGQIWDWELGGWSGGIHTYDSSSVVNIIEQLGHIYWGIHICGERIWFDCTAMQNTKHT